MDFKVKSCDGMITKFPSVNRMDKRLQTPLHMAVKHKHIDIINILLDNGADVKHLATKSRSVLHFLYEEAVNEDGESLKDDQTPESVYLQIIELLYKKGAPIIAKDDKGRIVLHYAALRKQKTVITFLMNMMEFHKAYDNFDNWRNSSLHLLLDAIDGKEEQDYLEIVRFMLGKCPLLINQEDQFGRVPLHIAATRGQKEIVKILLECLEKVNNKKK